MVNLPAGFDASLLVNDLSALGVYIVGAYAVYCAGCIVLKALQK